MPTASNSELIVANLEFDTIKSNLKTYLSSQSLFQDYDFEGSSLNILLDILSYNTHYLAYLANMSTNDGKSSLDRSTSPASICTTWKPGLSSIISGV